MKRILITGGTGLVGSKLSQLLLAQGHEVAHLSRGKSSYGNSDIKIFKWNISKQIIDPAAIQFADVIIHLAGAGVVEKSWSPQRKVEILNSRVLSTRLLLNTLSSQNHHVESFISASAIGIYGADKGLELLNEDSSKGTDFLADVVLKWENEVEKIAQLGIRTSIIRIGIVLSLNGGALPQMMNPIKWWVGSPLGTGDQIVSWIHIDDLCRIILFAFENEKIHGVYNAVSPNAVANTELMQTIARKLHKPLFMPNVPAFVLRFMLGEMAEVVLGGLNVSPSKILNEGFKFKYPYLSLALKNLLK
jgi:uncharacterized protein (TIGR01777 family)